MQCLQDKYVIILGWLSESPELNLVKHGRRDLRLMTQHH